MKFLRFLTDGQIKIGALECGEKIKELKYKDMFSLIESANLGEFSIEENAKEYDLSNVTLLSPIEKPIHDIICVGVNYKDHLDESRKNMDINTSEATVYFSKRATKIYGANEKLPDITCLDTSYDYEVELAVIIGKTCKNVSIEEAENCIFGYSVFNDVSARTLQQNHGQWYRGKSFDGSCVMGPWIVEKNDIEFPPKLNVKSIVNGEVRQNSNTELFIHNISEIISEFSTGCTLEAGDIIITGTPAGVGMGFNPPRYMKSGDTIECEVEKIGKISNIIE